MRVNAIDEMWAYRDVVDVVERVGDFVDAIVLTRVGAPGDVEFVDDLVRMVKQRIDLTHGIGIKAEIASAQGLSADPDRGDRSAGGPAAARTPARRRAAQP